MELTFENVGQALERSPSSPLSQCLESVDEFQVRDVYPTRPYPVRFVETERDQRQDGKDRCDAQSGVGPDDNLALQAAVALRILKQLERQSNPTPPSNLGIVRAVDDEDEKDTGRRGGAQQKLRVGAPLLAPSGTNNPTLGRPHSN